MTGITLPGLLRLRSAAASTGQPPRSTSVIWLWLGGGPTHVETFDPKMSAPAEFRSIIGMATIFHVLGINPQQQYLDQSGRPQFLLPEGARPITEEGGACIEEVITVSDPIQN